MKKIWNIIPPLIVAGIIIGILFVRFYSPVKGFEVTVDNLTEAKVGGLFLSCAGLPEDVEIPELSSHAKTTVKVQPENYGESNLKLYYRDNKGTVHEKVLIGYFEESYGNGYVKVEIEKSGTDGTLKVKSKYKMTGLFKSRDWIEETGK